ncbi:MAG: peptidyl-prolyl cis-trans isomerase [Gammaproteobacteria bacterium]|nr:peptidyl-prolyl cis-trans isomerase [Gammaproteobacteria bacterium]
MPKLLRDPLLHFLVLGSLLFVVYYALNPPAEATAGNQIRITQGDIDRLRQVFEKQRQYPPTAEELQSLIQAHLKEEVLYREALAMGLDKDDAIVRRRMAQKLEFLITDVTVPDEVDDAELLEFYEKNTADYMRAARLSFRHIYFNPDRRGERLLDEANAALQTLQTTQAGLQTPEDMGDRSMLETQFQQKSTVEISRVFGSEFADSIATLTPGSWQGLIRSGYGVHLVFIYEREAGGRHAFAEVRERVENDYLFELRQSRNEEVLDKLKSRYEIVIDGK